MSKFRKTELLRGAKIKRADGSMVTFLRWGRGAGGVAAWIDTGLLTMTSGEVEANNPQYSTVAPEDL
jgi:hypothetical protein